jgi:FdhE protein
MTELTVFKSEDIKKAVAAVKMLRPAYTEMVDIYELIFIAQEDSKRRINIDPIQIPNDTLSIKLKENFALINTAEFIIDIEAAENLFVAICETVRKNSAPPAASAQKILDSMNSDLDPQRLFSNILNGNDEHIEAAAKALNIEKNILAFITYSSIKPSVRLCAEQLCAYLDKQDPWQKSYCPICGSPPVLSMLEGEGERSLICSFCWHKWPVKRVFCPFCDTTDNQQLQYFFSEEEKEYRVYTCENCNKYIKTIDARNAERIIYPPLEQVVTLHLDMQANEKGFKSGLEFAMYD